MKVVATFDPPIINDCTVINIPGSGSAPVQVIAAMPQKVTLMKVTETTGKYMGLYTGPIGVEVFHCLVTDSDALKPVVIQKDTRVCLRSMNGSAITSGTVCCEFLASDGVNY